MRILILHQNKFDRMAYDRAIDHDAHDVAYAGSAEYIVNIPADVKCTTFTWDTHRPVTGQLRQWLRERPPFDRILARHELLIMPAAQLRAEFGIAGMRPDVAVNFRDKVAMKTTLARQGYRVPRFILASAPPKRAPWEGKTIVKPRDANASQGVRLCDDYRSARELAIGGLGAGDAFAGRYELEEYLDGPIWHVDGYLFRGDPVAIQSSLYVGTCLDFNNGKPSGSLQYPNPELETWTVEVLRALGGDTLTFHFEAIMTVSGPAFLEVAARCGGGYIVDMIRRRTGVYLHTLDMATEVEGELASRLIEAPASSDFHGDFLYPGHVYGGDPCTVQVPETLLKDPCVKSYRIAPPAQPTPIKPTYRPENLPFSGMIAGPEPRALEKWMRNLFQAVKVVPRRHAGEMAGR